MPRICKLALAVAAWVLLGGTPGAAGDNAGSPAVGGDALVWSRRRLQGKAKAEEQLRNLRGHPELPLVWLDVAINGTLAGRVEMVLFVRKAQRAAENFRLLCSGELGADPQGRRYHLKGSYFYRIIDGFICQTGADADGIFGGHFMDDPDGLQLKHRHKGLLSMAHIGPNTNGGHFSIMMGPAHHLDGRHVIFGTVVSGFEVIQQVNALARGRPNNELLQSQLAQIVDAGQTREGTYVSSPEFRAVIEAEKRRVAWRSQLPEKERTRLRKLFEDETLPLVYLDIAIRGVFAGRMLVVLFAEDAPWAAENFRLLCTGEAGVVPPGHYGTGKDYVFKGAYFYRIIDGFIDQAGVHTDSPLGGLFRDDPGGLRINHTHMGLLSMANTGPNTNAGHFSIMMGPAHHLDGRHPVFGELVDGHDVALAINALARDRPSRELVDSTDVQIVGSGQLRRGGYLDSTAFRMALEEERERLSQAGAAAAAG